MDDSVRKVEVSAFDAARIEAMDAYAALEQSIATLLAFVLDTRLDRANILFYRIVNTRSRCAIIADLLKVADAAEFVKPWGKIEKQIRALDNRRNNLVHWTSLSHHGAEPGSNIAKELKRSLINPRDMMKAITTGEGELTIEDVRRSQVIA